jgi:hypothetical protein
MGNKTAASIYQKMSLERAGEADGVKANANKKEAEQESDFVENKGTVNLALDLKTQLQMKADGKPLARTAPKKKRKAQEAFDEDSEEELIRVELDDIADFEATRALVRKNSIDADGFMRLLEDNRDTEEVLDQIKEIQEDVDGNRAGSLLQKEMLMFQEQKDQIETVIQTAGKKIKQYESILGEVKQENTEVTKELKTILDKNEELNSKMAKLDSGIASRKKKMESDEMRELEALINMSEELKDGKTRIKTLAKVESKKY